MLSAHARCAIGENTFSNDTATLLLWMISFKTRSSAPSRDQQQLADTRNVLAQCTQVLEETKCRLLKSSKQKAFENVRINSTTLLFLQARQSSSPQPRGFLTPPSSLRLFFQSAGCLTSSPCLKTLKDDLGPRPQATYNWGVSSLAKSAICVETVSKQHPWNKKIKLNYIYIYITLPL